MNLYMVYIIQFMVELYGKRLLSSKSLFGSIIPANYFINCHIFNWNWDNKYAIPSSVSLLFNTDNKQITIRLL